MKDKRSAAQRPAGSGGFSSERQQQISTDKGKRGAACPNGLHSLIARCLTCPLSPFCLRSTASRHRCPSRVCRHGQRPPPSSAFYIHGAAYVCMRSSTLLEKRASDCNCRRQLRVHSVSTDSCVAAHDVTLYGFHCAAQRHICYWLIIVINFGIHQQKLRDALKAH